MSVKVHHVKARAYPGSDFEELYPQARRYYNRLKAQTKRQPYVKSKYFSGQKVFIELFWVHLNQKNRKDRNKRLKFFPCGIELLRNTRSEPATKPNPNRSGELLHRFAGINSENELFYIQVKQNKKTGRKDLMSVFPAQ